MIKTIIQYLKDVRDTVDLSDRDDVIFIYLPLISVAACAIAFILILVKTIL